jgi:hypothetical protein
MTVTPISAPCTLEIAYKAGGLSHTLQMFCDGAYNSGTSTWQIKAKQTGTWLAPVNKVADVVDLLKVLFKTTASFDTWTLYENSAGVKIPRAQGSIGVYGTSTAAEAAYIQYTHYFRDTSYKPMKFILLGLTSVSIGRWAYSAMSGGEKALVDDILNTASGHVGEWITSRGFNSPASFLAVTSTANRMSRRRLSIE